ncbi:MAG: site-specific integrase [Phycisphaerae bacterium]|nr:site-specific integrase [Phycisphaerae bacterium]
MPYVLLTQERYECILKRWHKVRAAKQEWKSPWMYNNVLRDFRVHASKAKIGPDDGKLTFHGLRKSCARNWADCLPANVVKHYLGHSDIATTNTYYSKMDDLHMDYTTKVMDEMLEAEKLKALDAQQTREYKIYAKKRR